MHTVGSVIIAANIQQIYRWKTVDIFVMYVERDSWYTTNALLSACIRRPEFGSKRDNVRTSYN
ncbi:MAG: hypothetical protein BAJATHORv1_20264 [Candidatus Thorarchaeota archaeon]|nr:MAG: hypothetical protein BAJATHORv1_20264 [Candidatus Thorarchaeota archaeon]